MHKVVKVLAVLSILVAETPVIYAEDSLSSSEVHKNLVVVVRFSDDVTGDENTGYNAKYTYNDAYTEWQQFKSWFTAVNIPYFDEGALSLKQYMDRISNGAWNVESYFPQSSEPYTDTSGALVSGSQLSYITLPHDKDYYETTGDLQMIVDSSAIFNSNSSFTADSASWGTNGSIENLELVVQVADEPSSSDSLLWPHKSNASGAADFGGMKVYEYNLVNSKAVSDLGTVKHEYLHSVGLGDLYRVGDSSSAAGPVGVWDIMGSAAGQWPLAQSLVDLGFQSASSIQTVEGASVHTITLHTHYSAEDQGQAVKVYSPFSTQEYFVFEYRQKNSDVFDPDHLLPSSGLIVYRVNDNVSADSNGHRTNRNHDNGYYEDAIYVFRPGETGIHDSNGNLQLSALSTDEYAYLGNTADAHSTFGSSDMTKGIAENAIVDSYGKNTGLVATVTAQTDDSITFNLEIPDYSKTDLWDQAGSSADSSQASCISTAVDTDGIIFQSFVDNDSSVKVRSWNGSTWEDLGTAASGTLGHAALQCIGKELYCSFADYSAGNHSVKIAKWEGEMSWTILDSIPTGEAYANVPASAIIGSTMYLLVDSNNASLQLYQLNSTTGKVSLLGTPIETGYCTEAKICQIGESIAVICGDVGSSFSSQTGENVYVLESGKWINVYSEQQNTARNIACAGYQNGAVTLASFDKGVVPQIRLIKSSSGFPISSYEFSAAGSDLQDTDLQIDGSMVYITAVDGNGLVTAWYASLDDLDSWQQLGSDVISGAASMNESVSAKIAGKYLYVSSVSANSSAVSLLTHLLPVQPSVPEITITYLAGSGGTVTNASETVKADVSSAAGSEAIPDEGYHFVGWRDASGNMVTDQASMKPEKSSTGYYQSETYTAFFAEDIYQVTFDANGGQPASQVIETGKGRIIVSLPFCTYSGYQFDGWYFQKEGGTVVDSTTVFTGDITVYAHWSASSSKNVSERIYGDNRYETMEKVIEKCFPDGSDMIIVASGDNWPDALSASSLAGAYHCPIVLARQGGLSEQSSDIIKKLGSTKAVIIGGESALSSNVSVGLEALGIHHDAIIRLGGSDRTRTADLIEEQVMKISNTDTCIIASGGNFPDALSISAYAYEKQIPILLTNGDKHLSEESLAIARKFTKVIITGGSSAVSTDVEIQLAGAGISVRRLYGESRYETSCAIINALYGSEIPLIVVATGNNFPDALSGAATAGQQNGAVLLVDGTKDTLLSTQTVIIEKAKKAMILGGESAVAARMKLAIDNILIKN